MGDNVIKGFSRLSRDEKVFWLSNHVNDDQLESFLASFRMKDYDLQQRFEKFSENTLGNYHLPWGVAPNLIVDGQIFHVPMVTEESSVVAAVAKAAAFWARRGGFVTNAIKTIKKGQVHFFYDGEKTNLLKQWELIKKDLLLQTEPLAQNMKNRGGGIMSLKLNHNSEISEYYFQIEMEADTRDSMGANFINTLVEDMAKHLPEIIEKYTGNKNTDVLMAILSNNTPDCIVSVQAVTAIDNLHWNTEIAPEVFARRMKQAGDIAWHDVDRAVTHNKGIFNGVDAVVLGTGNDFRAVEAAGHAYASRSGQYRSLSRIFCDDNTFKIQLEIPVAVGVVGGLTRLHPMAEKSLELLGNPDAPTLMKIIAATGLASNFAALASLVTTGIQKGHMKMHLHNILTFLNIEPARYHDVEKHFHDKIISMSAVKDYLEKNPVKDV